jgi:formylglycine-generating enzyme required for sulfatase activity
MKTITGRGHAFPFPEDGSASMESYPDGTHSGVGFRLAIDNTTAILRGNSWDGLAPCESRTGMTLTARNDIYLGFRLVREDV